MQPDMIDEKVKENNQDKESRVLTKIDVPGEEICTSAYVQVSSQGC